MTSSVMNNPDKVLTANRESTATHDAWSRVAPLAICYFFVSSIVKLINSFIYLIPLLAINFSSIKAHPLKALFVVALILTLMFISSVLKYLYYFYMLTNDEIKIKQGVVKKSFIDLPFNKIQNVKIIQPFYYRPFNYACVELETAGSATSEAKIIALPYQQAIKLKEQILHLSESGNSTPDVTNEMAVSDNVFELNSRSISDLIVHGVTNNRVWIFLGFLAPFYKPIIEISERSLESFAINLSDFFDVTVLGLSNVIINFIVVFMIVIATFSLFSVLATIIMFKGYRLLRIKDRYVRECGLFTKHEISLKHSRVQMLIQKQSYLDKLFKRYNFIYRQVSTTRHSNDAGAASSTSKLLVPSITLAQSNALLDDCFNAESLNQISYRRISKRYIFRLMLLVIVPICAVLQALVYFKQPDQWLQYSVHFVCLLLPFLVILRWYRWGYNFSKSHVYIRKGFIGETKLIFPLAKIQQLQESQSYFMKKAKLTNVQFVLASGTNSLVYIPQMGFEKIKQRVLQTMITDKPKWM